jgi:hypothetical protein
MLFSLSSVIIPRKMRGIVDRCRALTELMPASFKARSAASLIPSYFGADDGAVFIVVSGAIAGTSFLRLHCWT